MNFEHRYSQKINNTKIAVLGIWPPPFGGVSVHIQRVIDQLRTQNNKVHLFNIEQPLRGKLLIAYLAKLFVWLIWRRPKIVYFHGTYTKSCLGDLFVLLFLKFFIRYQMIIIEHDCRHLYKRYRLFKWLYRFLIKRTDHVVLIGQKSYTSYMENAIPLQSYSIEGAFLPPVVSMASIVQEAYPSSIFIFMQEHTPLILMNAAHIMTIDGKDIYGFDLAFEMLAGIKHKYPDVGLIIGLARVDEKPYALLCDRMQQLGIAENIYILRDQKELWPLFEAVDIFIRPTRSDGASISLQEALYFKVPAIASDAVIRPQGAATFESENIESLINMVDQVLYKQVYEIKR